MFIKHIEVEVKPGHVEDYLASQAIWNAETRKDPNCLGDFTAVNNNNENRVLVLVFWKSEASYREWMATEHDRIAEIAQSDQHYTKLNITFLHSTLEHQLP